MAENARRRVRQAAQGAQPATHPSDDQSASMLGLPPGCPVTPLGLAGDVRYYLDAEKQLIALAARDHSRLSLLGLFGRQSDFIYTIDPWTRKNAEGFVTGWRPEIVAEQMMAACGRAGVWDPANRERGRGAWRGENGELILHLGDQVMIFEPGPAAWEGRIVRSPGLVKPHVYPAGQRAGAPAEVDDPSDQPGEELLTVLETWRWRRGTIDPVLMLGWIGAAMIGGALSWRPVVWLTGGKGTGKSTLQGVIKGLLGDTLIDLVNTSPAFIWQTLRHQTLPVAVDELEASEDNRKASAIVELARIAASGGRLGRGSDKHTPLDFTLKSCFAFSSVLMPPLMGPDRSRLAILELLDLPLDAQLPDVTPRRLRALGAALRRRMVEGWSRFDRTLEQYRRALATVGHSSRGADQFGTLLTCADLLLFRDETDELAAEDWVSKMQATDLAETADELRDEEQCLQHLLAARIDPYRKGELMLLGEWVNRAAGRIPEFDDKGEAGRVLASQGIRLARVDNEWFLAVANNHRALEGIFQESRWRTIAGVTGVWVQALRRLPGARRSVGALYFGGPTSKATLLPMSLIPKPDLQQTLPLDA